MLQQRRRIYDRESEDLFRLERLDLRINRDAGKIEFLACADNATGNLAAVRDEHLFHDIFRPWDRSKARGFSHGICRNMIYDALLIWAFQASFQAARDAL
jgi:hypothetical protein